MRLSLVLVVGTVTLAATAAAHAVDGRASGRSGVCTIAAPPSQATVEVQMAYADDFCELLAKALAGDVFRSPVIVSPDRRWHYPSAALSCRLRFRRTGYLTIRNSIAACRWLAGHAAGWQFDAHGGLHRPITRRSKCSQCFGGVIV